MKKERLANIELLRVIAMIMVTFLHALGHGGVLDQYEFGSMGYMFFWTLETLSYVAVNVFVLITGFFMVNGKFKLSRVLNLAVQVEFYSVLCLLIAKLLLHQQIGIKDLAATLLPLTGNVYWFASAYAILVCLSPLLNKFIHSLNQREHFTTCCMLCILFCVIPNLLPWSRSLLTTGSNFVWFIVLYLIAGYIRLYCSTPPRWFLKKPAVQFFLVYLACCTAGLLSRLVLGGISRVFLVSLPVEKLFYSYNSLIFLPASISLFMAFQYVKINNTALFKAATSLGSVCFGAYLISDHPLLRKPQWEIINLPRLTQTGVFPILLGVVAVVILIFLSGCAIEWARKKFMHILGLPKWLDRLDKWMEKRSLTS